MDKQLITHTLFDSIKTTIEEAQNKAKHSVNHIMTEAYWQIGRLIVEDKQKGNEKATYGEGSYRDWETDRKSTRLNSSHSGESRMPSSA